MAAPFIHLRHWSHYSFLKSALRVDDIVSIAANATVPAVGLCDDTNLSAVPELSKKALARGIQPIIGATFALRLDNDHIHHLPLFVSHAEGWDNLVRLVNAAHTRTDRYDDKPYISISELAAANAGLIALSGDFLSTANIGKTLPAILTRLATVFPSRFYVELSRHGYNGEEGLIARLVDQADRHGWPLLGTNHCFFPDRSMREAYEVLRCIANQQTIHDDARERVMESHHPRGSDEMRDVFSDLSDACDHSLVFARRCGWYPEGRKPHLPPFPCPPHNDEVRELTQRAKIGLCARLEAAHLEAAHIGIAPENPPPLENPPADNPTGNRQEGESPSENPPPTENPPPAEKSPADRQEGEPPARTTPIKEDEKTKNATLYQERLAYEITIIAKMGFAGYFLIVADFVAWAKENSIPVGPGRGSGAGSAVAWALGITDLDPIRHGLLFERFLNPERVSMPDFDIDFCQERRDEVIAYLRRKYGPDHVAHIITFGTLKARAVLRDVGRVLAIPYGTVDEICKLVPSDPANPVTLSSALESEAELKQRRTSQEVTRMMDISMQLEGLYRHASTHAAGIVIGEDALDQTVPLIRDQKGHLATQFSMKHVEHAGLVKFDLLGLKTLSMIARTLSMLRAGGTVIDLSTLSLDDKDTYHLLGRARTTGVFQLESAGMRDVLKGLRPDRFADIIAVVALYRPGPMDNIPSYIGRKHGKEKIHYLDPRFESILAETYGIIIYQEQVMEIARVMSGFSLARADLLRQAMGKKDHDVMAAQRRDFITGAKGRGVEENTAIRIFEEVRKFAGYGFNKSHAACYALIAYWTAWLKTHFPVEFLAASMSMDIHNTDKINIFREEAIRSKITIEPPDINRSDVLFSVGPSPHDSQDNSASDNSPHDSSDGSRKSDHHPGTGADPSQKSPSPNNATPYAPSSNDTSGKGGKGGKGGRSAPQNHPPPSPNHTPTTHTKTIRYGLAAVRNVGREAAAHLVAMRTQDGDFTTLADFTSRVDAKSMNKRMLENLAAAGAFDTIEKNRHKVYANADLIARAASMQNDDDGQESLFDKKVHARHITFKKVDAWNSVDMLEREFSALGFYLHSHPLDRYRNVLDRCPVVSHLHLADMLESDPKSRGVIMAGSVVKSRELQSRRDQSRLAFVQLADVSGVFEIGVFAQTLERCRDIIQPGSVVLAQIQATINGGNIRLNARDILAIDKVAAMAPSTLIIDLKEPAGVTALRQWIDHDSSGRANDKNRTWVRVRLLLNDAREITFRIEQRVHADRQNVERLRNHPSIANVKEILRLPFFSDAAPSRYGGDASRFDGAARGPGF